MNRAQALATAAATIARSVADLRTLVGLLELAGQRRLAAAIIAKQAPNRAVGGSPRPDAELWRCGRVR